MEGRRRRAVMPKLSIPVAAGLLAVAVTGGAASGARPSQATHKPTTVFIQLNWLSNVEFSGLWVADHNGWFRKAGFNFTFKAWSNGIDPEGTTAACYQGGGRLCFGFDDSAAVAIARDNGNDVKAVWVGSQKTPFGFITCHVPQNSKAPCKSNTHKNITSPKQWKNLKIGYQSHELYVPEIMLGSVGLNIGQVKPTVVQFDSGPLTTGGVDAFLVFINNEPISLALQGVKTNVIPAYKYGMQDFYADTMFAPADEISAHRRLVGKFVRLVDRGWKWAMHHPRKTADMVQRNYFKTEFGSPSSRRQQELEEKKFASTLSRDARGRISGRMTLKRWKAIVHILATYPGDLGGRPILHKPLPGPRNSFTNAFVPAPIR